LQFTFSSVEPEVAGHLKVSGTVAGRTGEKLDVYFAEPTEIEILSKFTFDGYELFVPQ
jgi:hypothetical protein